MAKRSRVLARGEEEVWRWEAYGARMQTEMDANVYYAHEHALPRAGIKDRGKVSMVECSKIAFYMEPWPFHHTAGFAQEYLRFAISANEFQYFVEKTAPLTGGQYNIHHFLGQPNVYWMHTESAAKNAAPGAEGAHSTEKSYANKYPIVYDVSAPDGQGILFKGKHVWTTVLSPMDITIKDLAQCSYTFYCLVRTVWVTPQYWVESMVGAGNSAEGGVLV